NPAILKPQRIDRCVRIRQIRFLRLAPRILAHVKRGALQRSPAPRPKKGKDASGIESDKRGMTEVLAGNRNKNFLCKFSGRDFETCTQRIFLKSRMRQRQKELARAKLCRFAAGDVSEPVGQAMRFRPRPAAIARNFVINMSAAPATEFDGAIKQPDDILPV